MLDLQIIEMVTVFSVFAWVLIGFAGFPPHSKNMHMSWTGNSVVVVFVLMCLCDVISKKQVILV